MMSRASLALTALGVVFCVAAAFQQPDPNAGIPAEALALVPKPQISDTLTMVSNVGSFKVLPKGDELPAGKLDFSFEGTVLVSHLAPGTYVKTSGNVRKEYDDKEHEKQVYFGKGHMLIVGKFGNCQWFGRHLNFKFQGSAIVRMISEFDSKLDTGQYWFDPSEKVPLQPNLINIVVPYEHRGPMPAITREEYEAKKKKLKGGG